MIICIPKSFFVFASAATQYFPADMPLFFISISSADPRESIAVPWLITFIFSILRQAPLWGERADFSLSVSENIRLPPANLSVTELSVNTRLLPSPISTVVPPCSSVKPLRSKERSLSNMSDSPTVSAPSSYVLTSSRRTIVSPLPASLRATSMSSYSLPPILATLSEANAVRPAIIKTEAKIKQTDAIFSLILIDSSSFTANNMVFFPILK